MSTNIEQVVAEFDDDFDYTFDLIVRRFMDACEETESAVNEVTCADDVCEALRKSGLGACMTIEHNNVRVLFPADYGEARHA